MGKEPMKRKSRLFWTAFVCLAFFTGLSTSASGFKVTGKISMWKAKMTKRDGNTIVSDELILGQEWGFETVTLQDQWLEASHLSNGQVLMIGSDGGGVYNLLVDQKAAAEMKLKTYPGSVFLGTYPVASSIYNTLPWLAFCSSSYFTMNSSSNSAVMPAPWFPPLTPLANIYRTTFTSLTNSQNLPQRVEFYADETQMELVRNRKTNLWPVMEKRELDNFDRSIKHFKKIKEAMAVYQVLSVTNNNGLSLPTGFSFEYYEFDSNAGEPGFNKRLRWRAMGKIATIVPVNTINPYPHCLGAITNIDVVDYRFRNPEKKVTCVRYYATNSIWLDASSPYLKKRFDEAVNGSPWRMARRSGMVIIIFLLVLAVVCGTVVLKKL